MCVGCRENLPKKQLVRVVKSPEGEISIDLTGKKSGRGAYICRKEVCLKKAQKTKALQRALETDIEPEIFVRLFDELPEEEDE
jgi:predicted RNA-binding protein YlxR (DUF448 family)